MPWSDGTGCHDLSFLNVAAAAKLLLLCLTVWPHRRQPTRFAVPGVLQVRTLEWVAVSFSNALKWKVEVKSLSRVWLLATPWTAAHWAPPSMGLSRQEYWSGVPSPSPVNVELKPKERCWLFDDLQADSSNVTNSMTFVTKSSNQPLIVFLNKIKQPPLSIKAEFFRDSSLTEPWHASWRQTLAVRLQPPLSGAQLPCAGARWGRPPRRPVFSGPAYQAPSGLISGAELPSRMKMCQRPEQKRAFS